MQHGLVLFYAKDRKLTANELTAYKSLPLILFVSREANVPDRKLTGVGPYDYKKGQDELDKSLSPSWRRPLSVIEHILNKCPNEMKPVIEEKWHLCPIILTYKHPYSIDYKDTEKNRKRNEMDHAEHIKNISNLLNDYNVEVVIDHSHDNTENIYIPLKNKPSYIYLDCYLGGMASASNIKVFNEIDDKVNPSTKKIIANIWDHWESEMSKNPT